MHSPKSPLKFLLIGFLFAGFVDASRLVAETLDTPEAGQPASKALKAPRVPGFDANAPFEVSEEEVFDTKNNTIKAVKTGVLSGTLAEMEKGFLGLVKQFSAPLLLVAYPSGQPRTESNRGYVTRQVLLKTKSGGNPEGLAFSTGGRVVDRPAYAKGYVILEYRTPVEAIKASKEMKSKPGVESAEPMIARHYQKMATPSDPLYPNQWHLENTGQKGGKVDIDINVNSVWDDKRGTGVTIGILDDGVDAAHPDLSPSLNSGLGYDFADGDSDPSPGPGDYHGTSVAGVSAAKGFNAIGVCGVAPDSKIVAQRLITGGALSDLQIANAFAYQPSSIQVKNNSWGSTSPYISSGTLTTLALANAAKTGRGGRGTIFTFSAGNSAATDFDANMRDLQNSMYTICVGAISDKGIKADYSEEGCCLVVSAPSNSFTPTTKPTDRQGITTTDRVGGEGYNSGSTPVSRGLPALDYADADYTNTFGGTSSACPVVSGVVALMLQERPNLGWRDVQEILIKTATQIDTDGGGWKTNGAALKFSHKYGAGLVNASAAVLAAGSWSNLGGQRSINRTKTYTSNPLPIPDQTKVELEFDFTGTTFRIEHVAMEIDLTHTYVGDLAIELTSPSGMVSVLRPSGAAWGSADLKWTFTSVFHWGEEADGVWKLIIKDQLAADEGTIKKASLKLYGVGVDNSDDGDGGGDIGGGGGGSIGGGGGGGKWWCRRRRKWNRRRGRPGRWGRKQLRRGQWQRHRRRRRQHWWWRRQHRRRQRRLVKWPGSSQPSNAETPCAPAQGYETLVARSGRSGISLPILQRIAMIHDRPQGSTPVR